MFGCLCFVHLPSLKKHKLSHQAAKCVFLGYSEKHKGYFCYDPKARHTCISCNAIFLEHIPFYSLQNYSHILEVSYLLDFSSSTSSSKVHKYQQVYCRRSRPRPSTPAPDPPLLSDPPPQGTTQSDA